MFGALVGRDLDNDSAAARVRAIHLVGLDNPPLAGRAPILTEVVRVGMLATPALILVVRVWSSATEIWIGVS